MSKSPADVEAKRAWLFKAFDTCWDVRSTTWTDLLQRELQPLIPEHVKANAAKVPVLAPIMEDNVIADVTIMTGNEPKIRIVDQEGTKESQVATENLRLHKEVWRRKFNAAGEVEKAIAADLVWPHGVSVARLEANKPSEYDGDEEGAEYDRARKRHFAAQEDETWKITVIDPTTCAWWPLHDFRDFVEDKEVELVELESLKQREAGTSAAELLRLARDTAGTSPEHQKDTQTSSGGVAHFVAYEYEQDGEWWRCEYVYPNSGNLQENGIELDRMKLPHKASSYDVIPSGSTFFNEHTDPHRRFRPKLYALGVHVEQFNTDKTLQRACIYSQLSDRGQYLSIPAQGLSEDARRILTILFPGLEEAPDGESLVTPLVPRKEGELLLMPGIIHTFPGFVSTLQQMANIIEEDKEWIRYYATNPFLTGRAYAEYQEGTGTAASLGTQNSQTVYGPHRVQIDGFWGRTFRKMDNCMISWDEDNEGKKIQYPASTTLGGQGKGNLVWVDADDARRHHIYKVETLVEMQQERLIREQKAEHDYEARLIGFEDLLREKGHEDPHRKAIELAEEGNLYQWQRENEAILMARRQVLTQTLLGLNLQAIGEQALALANPAPAQPPPGGPPGGGGTPLPRTDRRPGGAPALGQGAPMGVSA